MTELEETLRGAKMTIKEQRHAGRITTSPIVNPEMEARAQEIALLFKSERSEEGTSRLSQLVYGLKLAEQVVLTHRIRSLLSA